MLSFVLALVLVDLGGTEAEAGWVRAIVGLGAVAGFVLSAQADRIGRKRLLLITIVGYTACAALTALSPNLAFLTGAQFLSQIFLASEWAVAITIVTEEFPAQERGRALGIVTSMNTLGGIAVGLLAFSFAVLPFDVSWRAFYVLALLPLILIALGRRSMLETERYAAVKASEGFRELNHTSLLEPWKKAYRSDVLAVGIVTFLRHAVAAGAAFWWAYYAQQEVGDVRVDLRPVPRSRQRPRRGRVPRRRTADGSLRTQAGVPLVHGRNADLRPVAVPDPRRRRDAPVLCLAIFFGLGSVAITSAFSTEPFPTYVRSRAAAWCRNAFEVPGGIVAPPGRGPARRSCDRAGAARSATRCP